MAAPKPARIHNEPESHTSFPVFRALGEQPKGPVERLLSVFADVRAGEGADALLLAFAVFLLLSAYSLLKPVRNSLILIEHGADFKSYVAAAQAVLLMFAVPLYGWIGAHVNRVRLVGGAMIFFAVDLVCFYLAGPGKWSGVVFYIWLGIFGVFAISQFWAFANDIYSEAQGRRLFPMIGVGSSVGAVFGASGAALLAARLRWTPYTLMLVACAIILAVAGLIVVVNYRQKARATPFTAAAVEPVGSDGALELVFRDKYLLSIAALVVVLNVVNTSGEFLLSNLERVESIAQFGAEKSSAAIRGQFITSFDATYQASTNLLSLLLQMFATSRVIRYAGIGRSLFIVPTLSMLSYSAIAFAPALGIVLLFKILENGSVYSIQNTVQQALYLPTSRAAKYKAKAFNDSVCQRVGDVLQAALVRIGTWAGASLSAFAWVTVLLTIGWFYIARVIKNRHRAAIDLSGA